MSESLDGFSGVFPGYLHEPSAFVSVDSAFRLLTTLFMAFLRLLSHQRDFSRRRNVLVRDLHQRGGMKAHLERSDVVPFHLTSGRCTVGDLSVPWTQVFFIRLVPPAIHSSYVTLQIFIRHGEQHRFRLGADAYSEIRWIVKRMHELQGDHKERRVPDSVKAFLDESPTSR